MLRLSADVGGTFTDLVLIDDQTGNTWIEKVSSSPGSGDSIVRGIQRISEKAGVAVTDIGLFLHSFTIATNAWLTRSGADVVLLATQGYGDILQIGDQRRPDLYNLATQKPLPILDRSQVLTVNERLDAFGKADVALTDSEVDRVLEAIASRPDGPPEAVAISLLFSFLNPAHEERLAEAVKAAYPGLPVYLSSQINPKIQEYPRANTTAAAAYVGPAVTKYTASLEAQVRELKMSADILYMRSDGGTATPHDARVNPANLLFSGPAGGVVAGIQTAGLIGIDNLVTFDMGGTSADFALIANRRSSIARSRWIDGLPVRVPTLDIKAISAGGGSIAKVDAGGALKVGPGSAGSTPGPAAYGRGGTQATLTDALLAVGYMNTAAFADNQIQLDADKAAAAVSEHIAQPMGLPVSDAALGMLSIATANMAGAIRVISVERGQDLREFALLAFGGAGGLFAPFLLRELGMREVIIPPAPGVFAALGLHFADVRHDVQLAFSHDVETLQSRSLNAALAKSLSQLRAKLKQAGFGAADSRLEISADMRYVGQNHELNIALPTDGKSDEVVIDGLSARFSDAHETAYGYCDRESSVEITGLRVDAIGELPKPTLPTLPAAGQGSDLARPTGERPIFLTIGQPAQRAGLYRREQLQQNQRILGPAIIEQDDTTTLILDGQNAVVSSHGFIRISESTQHQPSVVNSNDEH